MNEMSNDSQSASVINLILQSNLTIQPPGFDLHAHTLSPVMNNILNVEFY